MEIGEGYMYVCISITEHAEIAEIVKCNYEEIITMFSHSLTWPLGNLRF